MSANVNKNIDLSGNHQGTLNRKNSIQNEMPLVHEGTLRKSYWNSTKNLTVVVVVLVVVVVVVVVVVKVVVEVLVVVGESLLLRVATKKKNNNYTKSNFR